MTTLVFHVIYPLHISLYYTQSSTSREATCKKPVESVSRSGTVCAQKSCDKKGSFTRCHLSIKLFGKLIPETV